MFDNFLDPQMIVLIICFLVAVYRLLKIMIKDKNNHIFVWIKYIPLICFLLFICTIFFMAGGILSVSLGVNMSTFFFGLFGILNIIRINRELKVCSDARKVKSLRAQRIVSVIVGIYGILILIVDFI